MSFSIFPDLLATDEPAPFEAHNPDGSSPILILCDHAGRLVPRALGDLGILPDSFDRHIAWDIGARDIVLRLCERFDARAICGVYSRLIIDLNRYPWDPASSPDMSDALPIPSNKDLTMPDRERRVGEIFRPYHDRVSAEIDTLLAQDLSPAILSVHTMTDRMVGGDFRPEEISICWAEDDRLSGSVLRALTDSGDVTVGDNVPYALDIGIDYTVPEHAMRRGLPSLQLEFRQDLVGTVSGAHHWADLFADALETVVRHEGATLTGG